MSKDPDRAAMLLRMEAALCQMPERQRVIFLAVRHDKATDAALAEHFKISTAEVEHELAAALALLSDAADGRAPSWRRLLLRGHRRYRRRHR